MESMPANPIATAVVVCAVFALHALRARALEVRVIDAVGGRPIAGASVVWRVGAGKSVTLPEDVAGKVQISLRRESASVIRVTAGKGGFVPVTMQWEPDEVASSLDP